MSATVRIVDESGRVLGVMSREAFDEAVADAAPLRRALLQMLADDLTAAQPNIATLYPGVEQS